MKKFNVPSGPANLPRIKFQLMGDWDKAMSVVARLGPNIKQSSIKAQLRVAKEIGKRVRQHLRDQDLGWKELSPKYEKKKGKAGLNTKTLMAYNTYYDNIETWTEGNRHLICIGVRRGIYTKSLTGKKSKLDVATIAGIHEFASGRRVPRRPLWNPTLTMMGGQAGIRKMYINTLVYHLRLAGVPVQKEFFGSNITIDGSKIKF